MKKYIWVILLVWLCNAALAITVTVKCTKNYIKPVPHANIYLYYTAKHKNSYGAMGQVIDRIDATNSQGVANIEIPVPKAEEIYAIGWTYGIHDYYALSPFVYNVDHDVTIRCNMGLANAKDNVAEPVSAPDKLQQKNLKIPSLKTLRNRFLKR